MSLQTPTRSSWCRKERHVSAPRLVVCSVSSQRQTGIECAVFFWRGGHVQRNYFLLKSHTRLDLRENKIRSSENILLKRTQLPTSSGQCETASVFNRFHKERRLGLDSCGLRRTTDEKRGGITGVCVHSALGAQLQSNKWSSGFYTLWFK